MGPRSEQIFDMSDTTLRELERIWKETGTVEDEAAYFTQRVRAGDLSADRIRLATYLCCPACRRPTLVLEFRGLWDGYIGPA